LSSPSRARELQKAQVLKVKLERSRAELQTLLAKRDHAVARLEAARAETERVRSESERLQAEHDEMQKSLAALAVALGPDVAAGRRQAGSIARLHEQRIADFVARAERERAAGPAPRQRPGPPLTVLVPEDERTILNLVDDPRLHVRPQHDATPDLVVLAANQLVDLVRLAGPQAEALARMAAGARTVVFDASAEGTPYYPEHVALMHRFLERIGLRPEQGIYLTQDRTYAAAYEAGSAQRMRVIACDFWIRRFFDEVKSSGGLAYASRLRRFQGRQRARARRFISLNLTVRVSKLFFLLSLLRDGLWDRGFVSVGGFERTSQLKPRDKGLFAKRMRATAGFADLTAELAPLLPQLESKGEILLGALNARRRDGMVVWSVRFADLEEYDDSWFSAITETEMTAEPVRITEKPLSALVNFHPIVMFGNPGALGMIRSLGFETFQGAIDERYDEVADPRRRFDMAYGEFARLCRMDEAEMGKLEAELAEKLVFNARWGLTELPRIYREQLDGALVDRILAAI
jgi:hypothetical protein